MYDFKPLQKLALKIIVRPTDVKPANYCPSDTVQTNSSRNSRE